MEWKWIEWNERQVTLFGSNIKRNEWNHFMTIVLLDPYFKIKAKYIWVFRSLSKKNSLNLIQFS